MYEQQSRQLALLPRTDRPRERLRTMGASALSNCELLALLLNTGTSQENVLKVAARTCDVIDRSSPENLYENLLTVNGIGDARALSICAAMEYVRRRILPSSRKIHTPEDVMGWLKSYRDKKQEHFIVISLNGGNEVLHQRVVTVGLLNSSQVHPREVFAEAIVERAASVILAHNHPSGNCTPSNEDIDVTRKLKSAGEILGVPVLDHIIFSENGFASFLEKGLI